MSGKMPWLQLTVASAGSMFIVRVLYTQTHVLLAWLFEVMGLGYALLRGELGYM
jgi:hypothetical protein